MDWDRIMKLIEAIQKLEQKSHLSTQNMEDVMSDIFHHDVKDDDIRNFLILLSQKGETFEEILGAVHFLRKNGVQVTTGIDDLIDCCGTGGSQKGSFNISTAVAFVLAGGGCYVAKHGNRAVSSKSGSADVLKALGVNLTMSPEGAIECLKKTGITFLYAPEYYPILKKVAFVRKSIPHRTIFNLLGPLLNPCQAPYQLLGVYASEYVPILTKVLKEIGSQSAVVVSSLDGLDEFSLTDKAQVSQLKAGEIQSFVFDPWQESGYPKCDLKDLQGGTPEENANRMRKCLKGHSEPLDHVVHINAAWGFIACGRADSFMDGLLLAQQSISSGKAHQKLEEFVEMSLSCPNIP